MGKTKRVAIYTRVSTGEQTTANQAAELKAWAERSGHAIVKVYEDKGISGAKGRDKRPAFDAMLKSAVRRDFDMLAVWSSTAWAVPCSISSMSCKPSATPASDSIFTRKRSTRPRRRGGRCSGCWPCSVSSSGK